MRSIGESFQSAITTPGVNLTGYGNAIAQSWRDLDRLRDLNQSATLTMGDQFARFYYKHSRSINVQKSRMRIFFFVSRLTHAHLDMFLYIDRFENDC